MRVIFLDFDGVLLPLPANGQHEPNLRPSALCVNCLNVVTGFSGASIVVTSSWRTNRSVAELAALLQEWGVRAPVEGKTPQLENDRGAEISAWLLEHGDLESFVILDDEPTDLEVHAKNVVHVRSAVGFSMPDMWTALRILLSKEEKNNMEKIEG